MDEGFVHHRVVFDRSSPKSFVTETEGGHGEHKSDGHPTKWPVLVEGRSFRGYVREDQTESSVALEPPNTIDDSKMDTRIDETSASSSENS